MATDLAAISIALSYGVIEIINIVQSCSWALNTAKEVKMHRKILVVLISATFVGCAAKKEIAYDDSIDSAIDFAKEAQVDLSSGLDKQLSKKNIKIYENEKFSIIETSFYPDHGSASIHNSFINYCNGLKGRYFKGVCLDLNVDKKSFYVDTRYFYDTAHQKKSMA